MKTSIQIASVKLFVLVFFVFSAIAVIGQDNKFIGTKKITNGNKSSFETIPQKNNSSNQTIEENKIKDNSNSKDRFVLDGSVLWSFQDGLAIANVTEGAGMVGALTSGKGIAVAADAAWDAGTKIDLVIEYMYT